MLFVGEVCAETVGIYILDVIVKINRHRTRISYTVGSGYAYNMHVCSADLMRTISRRTDIINEVALCNARIDHTELRLNTDVFASHSTRTEFRFTTPTRALTRLWRLIDGLHLYGSGVYKPVGKHATCDEIKVCLAEINGLLY